MQPDVPGGFASTLYDVFLNNKTLLYRNDYKAHLGSVCEMWDFCGYGRCVRKYIKNYKSCIREYTDFLYRKGWL